MLKDELFIRGPLGMMPTPRAEQLAMPVQAAMNGLQEALEPDEFEPGTTTQLFKIAVDNFSAVVLVAPIAAYVAKLAPGVRLDFRPSGTLNVLDLLDRSELDLSVGASDVNAERFTRKRLLQDESVAVMRRGHPLSKEELVPKDALADARQLEISSAQFGNETLGIESSSRMKRQTGIRAPILSAARILATSDFVCVLPLKVAIEMARSRELTYRCLVRPPKPIETSMVWLRRLNNQPGHAWLRNEIAKAVDSLSQAKSP